MRLGMLIAVALLISSCGTDKYELWGKYAATQRKIVDRNRDAAVLEANTAAFFALKDLGEIVEVRWSREQEPSCGHFILMAGCPELEYGLKLVGGARPVSIAGGGSGYYLRDDAELITRHLAFISEHPVSFTVRSSRDASGLELKVRLTNHVGSPIVVDRELRIGLALAISGVEPAAVAEREKPIAFIRVAAEVPSGLRDLTRSRFMLLGPGESLERSISFADAIPFYRPAPGSALPRPGQPPPPPEEIVCVLPRSLIRTVDVIYDTTQRELVDGLGAFTGRPSTDLTLTPLQFAQQVQVTPSYLYEVPAPYRHPTAAGSP